MMAEPPGNPVETGAEQARSDLAHGKPKLLMAGGYNVYMPGVPTGDPRFDKLPIGMVPSGPSTPYSMQWFEYARAYNTVIVQQLRK